MAVDIYCYIERHKNDKWQFVGELVPYPEHQYDPEAPELAPSHILHSVNKELASILVDTGWAICAVEPYTAVVSRRGKPHDLSCELTEYFRYFDGDDGTVYSWFTATELSAFDISSHVMTRQAYVPDEAAKLFGECPFGFPMDRWPTGTPIKFAEWSRDGVQVRWKESYATIIKEFIDVVPMALAKSGPPDSTRLVVQANW